MAGRLKLAFVGCGAVSRLHLLGIQEGAPEIRITAAIDPDPSRAAAMAKKTGAAAYTSLDEALASGDFDAVDVMVPHHLHETVTLPALAAGKHVLLEKPMAPTLPACERILRAAQEAGTVFMVAENAQYWPEVVTAKGLVECGAIGRIVTARASAYFPPLPDYYGGDQPWRFDKRVAGGGIVIDGCSHWIRPLRMCLGEIDEVIGGLGRPVQQMEGESLALALLRFRSGVLASFDAVLSDAPVGPLVFFRVMGTTGEITIDAAGQVMLYDAAHRGGQQVGEVQGYFKSYAGEFRDFASAVLEGTPLAAGPEDSLGELRAALAMYRSAETQRWERVWG
jgi:UDP-N-acetyl-2-amino-2-deoxyglucuronate dehydrogenase